MPKGARQPLRAGDLTTVQAAYNKREDGENSQWA
jgi:hypothetical protein